MLQMSLVHFRTWWHREIGGDTRALSYLVPSSPFSCFPHRLFHQVSLLSMELRKCRDAPRIYLCLQAVAEGSMVTFEIITSQVDGKPTACHVQVPSQCFRLVNCVLCCVRISTTYYTDAQQNPRGEFPFCTTHYHEDSLAHLEPFVNFCALFVLAATHGVDLTLSPCLSHSSLAFGHKIHIDRSVPWPPQQRNWRVHNSCFCRTCFDTTVTRNARPFLARANLLKSTAHILRPFESTGSDLVWLITTQVVFLGRSKSALCFLTCIIERLACRTTVCAVRPGSGHCWFAENDMNKTHATKYCHVSSFFCGWVSGIFPGGDCGEGEGFRDKRWSSARLEADAGVHASTWLKWKFTVEMLRMPCVIHRHTTSLHLFFFNFPSNRCKRRMEKMFTKLHYTSIDPR